MYASTSRVSRYKFDRQSTAASKVDSTETAFMIVSNSEDLTISSSGISRIQEVIHSIKWGFDAALAVLKLIVECGFRKGVRLT